MQITHLKIVLASRVQKDPVYQEKELELCFIVLLNTVTWCFSVVLLKIIGFRENPTATDLKMNFVPFEK